MKSEPELIHLPVIVYTTSAKPDYIQSAYDHGAALYVVKPELYPELVATLTAVLSTDWREPGAYKQIAHMKAFRIPSAEQTDLLLP